MVVPGMDMAWSERSSGSSLSASATVGDAIEIAAEQRSYLERMPQPLQITCFGAAAAEAGSQRAGAPIGAGQVASAIPMAPHVLRKGAALHRPSAWLASFPDRLYRRTLPDSPTRGLSSLSSAGRPVADVKPNDTRGRALSPSRAPFVTARSMKRKQLNRLQK